ncbi:hypothetical protein [Peribacillus alkalitolerans]|nr:hypothetical protein [Peribacillus alkalitolerans]
MNSKNMYSAAVLEENVIDEIKAFENKIKSQTNKDVVVIAYEKEGRLD